MSSKNKSKEYVWSQWSLDPASGRYCRYRTDRHGRLVWDFLEEDDEQVAGDPRTYNVVEDITQTLEQTGIEESDNYTHSASGDYSTSPPTSVSSKGKAVDVPKQKSSSKATSSKSSRSKDSASSVAKERSSSSKDKHSSSRGTSSKQKKQRRGEEGADDPDQDSYYPRGAPEEAEQEQYHADPYAQAAVEKPRGSARSAGRSGVAEPALETIEEPTSYPREYQTASTSRTYAAPAGEDEEQLADAYHYPAGRDPSYATEDQMPTLDQEPVGPFPGAADDASYDQEKSSRRRKDERRRRDEPAVAAQQPQLAMNQPVIPEIEEEEEDPEVLKAMAESYGDYEGHSRSGESSSQVYEDALGEDDGQITPRATTPTSQFIRGTLGEEEVLDPRYKVEPSVRFHPGAVFKVLWSEPEGASKQNRNPTVTDQEVREYFGQRFYVTFRRFVVVANDEGHCTCVPILTYGGKGCTKSGAKPNKHGVVHQHGKSAHTLRNEPKLGFAPVAMYIDASHEKLAKESRINYAKLVTIEHNVKVFFIGRIVAPDFERVSNAVDRCWQAKLRKQQKAAHGR